MTVIEHARPSAAVLAGAAVLALCEEARLSPKPGLVDGRGGGAHDDMDLPLMLASAEALRPAFHEIAQTAERTPAGAGLRERLGVLGRRGERAMLRATGGVNTHRGALWALGLLVAAVAGGAAWHRGAWDGAAWDCGPWDRAIWGRAAAREAARLAALPDRRAPVGESSHGDLARSRYGAGGARREAENAFPHVTEVALPRLRAGRAAGLGEEAARLDALLAVMSLLDDTCVLHRGGPDGLRTVRSGARRVLAEGGASTGPGRAALMELDDELRARRLSPGGSGDLLAAALFLDMVPWPEPAEQEVLACRR
ncbi:triphosphoribosyl-dephospho-CoA synthase [Nonomuraea maheshkhaliensis]|uniref:triphosphoribosyl-dephospho-CoA synthase n=1 Tax=Nonomuraea maheshkhaliensis TaxID=419590 RepID=A0ABN2FB95_9ACTN